MSDESLEDQVRRLVSETIEIVDYDARWPESFEREERGLRALLPSDLVGRIEHFGSTAVPGLAAKPVVDMLIEVTSLDAAGEHAMPLLRERGDDVLWRPTFGDDGPPWYWWSIMRDERGVRSHHLHFVERCFSEHWQRLLFRDHLIAHPEIAADYATLKRRLASEGHDRAEYTRGKTAFVQSVMEYLGACEGDAS